MKTCTTCGVAKRVSDYYAYQDGRLQSRCKVCARKCATTARRRRGIGPKHRAFDKTHRICSVCRVRKPLNAYYRCSGSGKSHTQSVCKVCTLRRSEQYRRARGVQPRTPGNPTNTKIGNRLRTRVWHALHGAVKPGHTQDILGCTFNEFRLWLEAQFKPGMHWTNYGLNGWHIGHVVDCCAFDLTVEAEVRRCFHYTNLQPQWSYENWRKPRMRGPS